MSATRRYDLYSHEFRVATHETYARMRQESPVHLQPGLDGETPIWFVTRYEDVVALLTDNERFVLDPALALTPDELAERRVGVVPSPTSVSTRTRWRRTARTIGGSDAW
jgi:cytochrome P450